MACKRKHCGEIPPARFSSPVFGGEGWGIFFFSIVLIWGGGGVGSCCFFVLHLPVFCRTLKERERVLFIGRMCDDGDGRMVLDGFGWVFWGGG